MDKTLDTLTDDLRLRYYSSDRSALSQKRSPPVFTRPFTVISGIETGEVEIEFNQRKTTAVILRKGDVCALPLNLRRHARALYASGAQAITAGYLFEIRGGMDLMHFIDLPSSITGKAANRIHTLLSELHLKEHEFTQTSPLTKSIVRQRIGYALLEILLSVSQIKVGALSMRRILPVVEHMSEHYSEPLDIAELIRHTGFSRTHFFRVFKQWTGITPVEYIKQQRIREASLILIESQTPIAEVGEMVGYTDPFFFSKVFKSVTGLSPSAYRDLQGSI